MKVTVWANSGDEDSREQLSDLFEAGYRCLLANLESEFYVLGTEMVELDVDQIQEIVEAYDGLEGHVSIPCTVLGYEGLSPIEVYNHTNDEDE